MGNVYILSWNPERKSINSEQELRKCVSIIHCYRIKFLGQEVCIFIYSSVIKRNDTRIHLIQNWRTGGSKNVYRFQLCGGVLWTLQWICWFPKRKRIYWATERLKGSQERFCSAEWEFSQLYLNKRHIFTHDISCLKLLRKLINQVETVE
jgi:hypothetical protein